MRKSLSTRLTKLEQGGDWWQNLPMILEYDKDSPKPWGGFATRAEAAEYYWRVHRCRINFYHPPEDPRGLWGEPMEGEEYDFPFLA